jgi:two-component system sensor histidine kinase PilS (NtrC family)
LIICCIIASSIQEGGWDFTSFTLHKPTGHLLQAIFVLNIVYLFATPLLAKHLFSLTVFQLVVDIIVETALIYLTGGIFSIFNSLYFVSIVVFAILLSPNSSLLCASVATISIAVIAFLYFLAAIENITLPLLPEKDSYMYIIAHDLPFCKAYLFAQAVAFYLVAFLSSRLAITLSHERILQEEILQNLVDGVMVVTTSQNLIFLNNKAKDLLHLQGSNVLGKSVTQVLDVEKHKDILKALKMRSSLSLETELVSQQGVIPVQLTVSPIAADYRIRALILILRDISDQKRMEEALQRAKRLTAVSETAATIAHEIRNPLASIRGAIQELRDIVPPDDPRYVLLNISMRESDRVNRIISEFLEFARLRPSVFIRCDIKQLINEFIILCKKRPEMERGELTSDIEKDLLLKADAEHLKQVFYNIAINAIEASEIPSIHIRARYRNLVDFFCASPALLLTHPCQRGVEISFHDKGKGISAPNLLKLFTPFFTTKTQGTGMGLAFVHKIVEFHHGLLHVDSKLGEGSTFYLWLPEDPYEL